MNKVQFDEMPAVMEAYDKQGRIAIRWDIEQITIPESDMMPAKTMYECYQAIAENNSREAIILALNDYWLTLDKINEIIDGINEVILPTISDLNNVEVTIEPVIIEPTRFAKFNTIEEFNAVNHSIVSWKDKQTNGEYSRTNTKYEYNPTPEPHADGFYYMPAEPTLIAANLFEGVTLLDSVPTVEQDQTEQQ